HLIRHGDEVAGDLAAGRLHRIERQAKFVAAHLEEHGAFAALGDGRHPAILAAFDLLDADDLGAQVAQHGAAERAGDVPAEIENAYSFQNAWHRFPTYSRTHLTLRGAKRRLEGWETPLLLPMLRDGASRLLSMRSILPRSFGLPSAWPLLACRRASHGRAAAGRPPARRAWRPRSGGRCRAR